jgi:hypothetical protein
MAMAALRTKLCALAVADEASPLFGLPPDSLDFGEGLIRNRSGNDEVANSQLDGINA